MCIVRGGVAEAIPSVLISMTNCRFPSLKGKVDTFTTGSGISFWTIWKMGSPLSIRACSSDTDGNENSDRHNNNAKLRRRNDIGSTSFTETQLFVAFENSGCQSIR
jgi:hypothetical protein